MTTPGISPYIGSMESLHPNIQYELLRRSMSSETVNVYMPYVRLTSLSKVLGDNLKSGKRCDVDNNTYFPSLGIHGEPNVSFDDIYGPTTDNRSIVGYATGPTTTTVDLQEFGSITLQGRGSVPVLVSETDAQNDPVNIPMPGIISMNAERSTTGPMGVRGGLFKATLTIRAYSTGQVNTLLRYFLRPATRLMLEMGRRSSNQNENFNPFDWNRTFDDINQEIGGLVKLTASQSKFITKYIYGNNGNYEIFIGYVVSFKLKYAKDNVYDIELVIHSLQQFEVPLVGMGIRSINQGRAVPSKCKAIGVDEYFKSDGGYRQNSFVKLMQTVTSNNTPNRSIAAQPPVGTNWNDHVIKLRGSGGAPGSGGMVGPSYLVSWQFFVDVLLNDNVYGILSLLQLDSNDDALLMLRSSVLRAIGPNPSPSPTNGTSLNSNEVSWSKYLRSIDPNVMIIHNKLAQALMTNRDTPEEITRRLVSLGLTSGEDAQKILEGFGPQTTSIRDQIVNNTAVGEFKQVESQPGVSYLTKGVWINTNAIIDSFSGADTMTDAINKLLISMNNASGGLWNLQLLSNDTENPGMHVIDMGLSKSTRKALLTNEAIEAEKILGSINESSTVIEKLTENGTPKYLYMFNRELKSYETNDIGSELLDVTLESSLPHVVAVQAIAGIGGPMERGTLQAIDINELQRIAVYNTYPSCSVDTAPCDDGPQQPARGDIPTSTAQQIATFIQNPPRSSPTGLQQTYNQTIETYLVAGVCRNVGENATPEQTKACDEDKAQRQQKIDAYVGQLRQAAIESYETKAPGYLQLVNQYGGMFGQVLDLVEYDTVSLQKKTDCESAQKDITVHPFNSSNLTKTLVDLTLPGIGGLQLFQAFGVRRVPSIVNRGYYVITKIAHEFSTESGWITKVQGRFRFNPDLRTEGDTPTPCPPIPGQCGPDTPVCEEPASAPPPPPPAPVTPSTAAGNQPATAPQSPRAPNTPRTPRTPRTQPNTQPSAALPTTREDFIIRTTPTASNRELVERLEQFENSTDEPSFGASATREDWQRRVQNGSVARDRVRLNATKIEIKKRINAGIQARRGTPVEFQSISDARLRPSR